MSGRKKIKTANSEALETTEKVQEAMSRDELKNVDENVTEEVAKSECSELEETNENIESEELDNDNTREMNVKFYDLCSELEVSLTRTTKLETYSQSVFHAFTRTMKHTIFLVGDEGCGKKTIIQYVAYRIAKGLCPVAFSKHKSSIYMVNMDLIAMDKKCFVSNVNNILENARSKGIENLMIYLDNVVTGIDLFCGMYEEIMSELHTDEFRSLKFIATFDDGQLMTEAEEQDLDDFMTRYGVVIKVEPEEKPERILRVLRLRINELENKHNVEIPEKVLETLLMCHYGRNFTDNFNYSKFLVDVDAFLAMVEVYGVKTASSEDIKKFYRKSFEIMSKLPEGYNYVTAVHESGHILLQLTISKLYTQFGASLLYDAESEIEAITMVKKTQYMTYNEEDMIDYVAMVLAGRAAELTYCVNDSSYGMWLNSRLNINKGSSDDIKNATDELRTWVIYNGAYRLTGYHLANAEYDELSPIEQYKVDLVVKWLLNKAFRKSMAFVKANKDFIMEMQAFLLENITATHEDILKIARRTIKY